MSQSLENLPREGGQSAESSNQRETVFGVDPGNQQGSRGLRTRIQMAKVNYSTQHMLTAQRHVALAHLAPWAPKVVERTMYNY